MRAAVNKTPTPMHNVTLAHERALPRGVSCFRTPSVPCKLFPLCMLCPLAALDMDKDKAHELISVRRHVTRGASLYRAGDAFGSLYVLHTGFVKSSVVLENGKQQITGFHMAGEMMGMDGISTGRYALDATALENSDVYVIPFERFEKAAGNAPRLQREFHRMMSREMDRDQGVMMLLGNMRANERVALFLLDLSVRFAARGYSPLEFNLRMSRDEIGSYLGLKLETVSRIFSELQDSRLLAVKRKHIRIVDIRGLERVMHQAS